jgi:hypothetical protein
MITMASLLIPIAGKGAPLLINIDDISDTAPITAQTSDPINHPVMNPDPGPGEQLRFDVNLGVNIAATLFSTVLCERPGPCMFDPDNNVINASDVVLSQGIAAQTIHVTFQSDPDIFLTHSPDHTLIEDGTFQPAIDYVLPDGTVVATIRVRSDIPEPGTAALLGVGMLSLLGWRLGRLRSIASRDLV